MRDSVSAAPARPEPAARNPMTVALVLVAGSIMATLDQTIVNVAINRLSAEFTAPLATIQWVSTGYALAVAAVVPVAAWAMGRFGAKNLYLVAVTIFAVGSLLAGMAWNIESLIAFRVLQGLGGGLLMPVGMTVLLRAASPERLGRAMSTMGLAILVGPLAGPVLGGYLIDEMSWRWMFYVNVPVAAAVLFLAPRVFPADEPQPRRRIDTIGVALMSPGLALLIYGITTAGEYGGFPFVQVVVPLVAGGALVAVFVHRGFTAPEPLLDLRILRRREVGAAATLLGLFAAGYFGAMLLQPLYFQVVRGESALVAGALGIPFALASGITMQVAGRLIDRFPPGRYLPLSIAVGIAGFLLFRAQLDTDSSYWGLCAAMLLMGAGGGGTMMPAITTATRALTPEQQAGGSTTVNLINTTAMAIGTAVVAVVLSTLLPIAGGLQALHGLDPAAYAALAPALAEAFRGVYLIAPVLMALAVIPALFLPRR
ncbi:DHA2 family efflux MFS transporter permease subunit [Nocardia flavorosea]|uniref:DHA2 family efflux MFS transporter permease subunit n=1 Tax=Nocardia flavorosea TaxID=53429 RepID=A0A846YKE2_9NOCA|nr:DHA2 family efflux MFS transporter permease subunit [Nocardia flavorosea]NKY60106.1 DHA2 family efflux MFS transporter permease subunit [Nocardia flavorosea]